MILILVIKRESECFVKFSARILTDKSFAESVYNMYIIYFIIRILVRNIC